jgi:prepilin-type processing-associated H-X9-DG protein
MGQQGESNPPSYGRSVLLPCPSKKPSAGWSYAAGDWQPNGTTWGFLAYGNKGTRVLEFSDGLSNTVAIGELWWHQLGPLANTLDCWGCNLHSATSRSTTVLPYRDGTGPTRDGFGGPHPGGIVMGFADGSVRVVGWNVNAANWRAMGTRAGGETVGE